MNEVAWRSVDVIKNKKGEPHVLQQKVNVSTAGMTNESSGYTNRCSNTDWSHWISSRSDLLEKADQHMAQRCECRFTGRER